MPKAEPKLLLVEDGDHLSVISNLMQRHASLASVRGSYEVFIRALGSVTKVLDFDQVSVEWQNPKLERLALIVDADGDASERVSAIRDIAIQLDLPWTYAGSGPIKIEASDGRRFGAWIMPDNQSAGMVESFCTAMIDTETDPIWRLAYEAMFEARRLGAQWRDTHMHRCHLYTWLSWQDTPGSPMGLAISKGILAGSPKNVQDFIEWFCDFYDVKKIVQGQKDPEPSGYIE